MSNQEAHRAGRAHAPEPSAAIAELMEGLTMLANRLTAIADEFHRNHGLHGTDSAALHALGQRSMTMGELADALKLSPAAVTSVVDRLEAAGLAGRRPDERDRRRTIVSALPVADPAADDVHRRVFEALGDVPPDELASTTRIVAALRDALG